jgi:hypothetical protein
MRFCEKSVALRVARGARILFLFFENVAVTHIFLVDRKYMLSVSNIPFRFRAEVSHRDQHQKIQDPRYSDEERKVTCIKSFEK